MQPRGAIWLVGMMGAGKSTVGRLLAERLGCPFADSDAEVERAAGRSVAEIFAAEGEAGFRKRERAAVRALAQAAPVVALGGGAVAQPGLAAELAATGMLVYLRARPETLLARVGEGAERPLLAGLAPEARLARLRALLAERRAAYERAPLVVDTDDREPAEIAAELAGKLAAPRAGQGAR